MNIGVIDKNDFFDIGVLLKKSFENKYQAKLLKYTTLSDKENIDILIFNNLVNDEVSKSYFDKLNNHSIIIANIDDYELIKVISNQDYNIISFGYNPKSTITLSSFINGDINTATVCIQRELDTIDGTTISEHEFQVNTKDFLESEILLIVSTLITLGFKSKEINSALLNYNK